MSDTKRESLDSSLSKSVMFHFRQYGKSDLTAFTVERQKSDYPKAKSDLVIFNADGRAIIQGREFGGGQTSLWSTV